ncbi:MAG: hypothetical protein JRN59_00475 [Nitrososphaerota archaeon]|nr:hypothetical protein [Nitrososphaerota archaeon]
MQPQREPDDREPVLARRSPFEPDIKLCPRCLTPLTQSNKDLWGFVPAEYLCPKCGYSGSVYLEKEPDAEKR